MRRIVLMWGVTVGSLPDCAALEPSRNNAPSIRTPPLARMLRMEATVAEAGGTGRVSIAILYPSFGRDRYCTAVQVTRKVKLLEVGFAFQDGPSSSGCGSPRLKRFWLLPGRFAGPPSF